MKNNKQSGIYKIINVINNKIYIGSAINFHNRLILHLRCLKNNKHHSKPLQNAWNKYGEESFTFEIIEYCEKELLIEREQYYLDILKPEYNICKIVGSRLGIKNNIETNLKISEKNKGKQYLSDDEMKLLWESNCRSVLQFDLLGNFVKEWNSISEAENSVNKKGIGGICVGKYVSVGGFVWRYKDEYSEIPLKINVREKYKPNGYNKHSKKIGQFNKHGELLNIFYGIPDAVNKTGESDNVIWRCLKNIVKKPRKYIWKYLD